MHHRTVHTVGVCMCRPEVGTGVLNDSFETRSPSLNQELTDSARVAGQEIPSTHVAGSQPF